MKKQFDGCSGGMSKLWRLFGSVPPWEHCCDAHDRAYAKGGTKIQRETADIVMYLCVYRNGYPNIARLMYYAVRVGGVPWTMLPFRWGFETKLYRYKKD